MGFDEEVTYIQASLKTLRFDYDLFFSGAAKFPPFKLRTELEKRVRKLGREKFDRLADRFKLQSVMTTYNSSIALWEKQMKLRESGIRDPRLAAAVRTGKQEMAALDTGTVVAEMQAAAENPSAVELDIPPTPEQIAAMEKNAGAALKATQLSLTAVNPAMVKNAAQGKGGSSFKIGARAPAVPASPSASPYAKLFDEFAQLKKQTGEKLGYDLDKFSAMMEKKKAELQAKGLKEVNFGLQVKDGKVILKAKSQS